MREAWPDKGGATTKSSRCGARRALALVTCAATLLAAVAAAGGTCGAGVAIGDTREEVAQKCGEALFREERAVQVEVIGAGGEGSTTTTNVEEWTFAGGPGEVMQCYRFENGKVAAVIAAGYGRLPDGTDSCRNGELLALGDSSLTVYLKCGDPTAREAQPDRITETASDGETRRTSVTVTEWTYRYGPDLPGVKVRIENGAVTEIRTREWGK